MVYIEISTRIYIRFGLVLIMICGIILTGRAQNKMEETVEKNIFLAKGKNYYEEAVTEKLIIQIKEATKKFKNVTEAEKAGYRPFGPDMPNMGQHWINTRIALSRDIDLKKPSTLTYLTVRDSILLTGVAYTTAVQPDEEPPALPIPDMNWHFHAGDLEDEAHGIHRHNHLNQSPKVPKLAMVHAWVWTENPAGIFSADNWAISYLRHNLSPPEIPSIEISKALFLASGQVNYFLKFIELCLKPTSFDSSKIKKTLDKYSNQIRTYLSDVPTQSTLNAVQESIIKNIWIEMWKVIEKDLGPEKWAKVEKFS